MTKNKEDFGPRYIPADIKREVRQACGFGCVICRCPLYEYDHIEEYSVVGEHKADNLALLCPNCHTKKGKKQITKEWIRECKRSARSKLLISDRIQKVSYTIDLGSNLISNFDQGYIFDCDNFGFLFIDFTDSLSLTGKFFDHDGAVALEISDNELQLNSNTWDIEYVGSKITFRSDPRKIFLSIDINSQRRLITITGKYFINEIPVTINEKGVCLGETPIALQNIIHNADIGLMITSGLPTNQSGEPIRGMVTGYVQRNTFLGYAPIFIMNPKLVAANVIDSGQIAIFINHDFLIQLHKQLKEEKHKRE
jgi:hypothetical protein